MRTSPPRDFTSSRSDPLPGTRSMSPKLQKITSGREAMATALSTSSTGVTHTGQPGPWMRRISGGSSSSMPKRTMLWVWPPHTSMMAQGRVTRARMASIQGRAAAASRYSSTNLKGPP